MTTQDEKLSGEQKELVAVGASVGAGCQPCLSHHLKAGAQTGLEGERLLAAVASAERVAAEAAVAMGDHARARLGASVGSPSLLSRLEEALASLGAALAANDKANIERQLRAAADLGASGSELQQAIDTAHSVQESAARIHLREAERLLDALALAPAAAATRTGANSGDGCGCGCGTNDETQEEPVTAEEPEPTTAATDDQSDEGCGCGSDAEKAEAPVPAAEPVAATSRHAARGFGEMATQFAAGRTSGAMTACRETFEPFMSTGSPAETDKAPAATAAAGGCKKEG